MKLFLQRFLVIFIFAIIGLFVAYSCSAINKVSNYSLNINDVISRQYTNENRTAVLMFQSETEAYLSSENDNDVYTVTPKDNLIYLDKESTKTRHIFIPISNNDIFWQDKNMHLYFYMEE